jgi:hypothetical protein
VAGMDGCVMDGNRTHLGRLSTAPQTILKTYRCRLNSKSALEGQSTDGLKTVGNRRSTAAGSGARLPAGTATGVGRDGTPITNPFVQRAPQLCWAFVVVSGSPLPCYGSPGNQQK